MATIILFFTNIAQVYHKEVRQATRTRWSPTLDTGSAHTTSGLPTLKGVEYNNQMH